MRDTMIVNCVHPVPVRHVPYRGRNERVDFLRRTTPIELRTLPESEFESVDYRPPADALFKHSRGGDRDPELFARDGRLWHRMAVFGQSKDDRRFGYRNFMRAENFVAILEGRDPAQDDFGKHFAQTPLAALLRRTGSWRGNDMDVVTRGEAEPAGMARGRVVADLHAPATAALHALFADEVALVGEEVFVRVAGPLVVHDSGPWSGELRVTLFPRMFSGAGTPFHIDGLAEARRHMERPRRDARPGAEPPGRTRVPRHLLGNDDIEIFALEATRALAHDLRVHVTVAPEGRWRSEPAVVALIERLADEVPLSRIGALPPMDIEDRLVRLQADLDAARGVHRVPPYALEMVAAYIEGYALPRLRAGRAADPADDEALAGLAPQ